MRTVTSTKKLCFNPGRESLWTIDSDQFQVAWFLTSTPNGQMRAISFVLWRAAIYFRFAFLDRDPFGSRECTCTLLGNNFVRIIPIKRHVEPMNYIIRVKAKRVCCVSRLDISSQSCLCWIRKMVWPVLRTVNCWMVWIGSVTGVAVSARWLASTRREQQHRIPSERDKNFQPKMQQRVTS